MSVILRQARAAVRLQAAPMGVGAALVLALIGVLLVSDRGSDPIVLVDGRWAPYASAAGAIAAGSATMATWGGLLAVGVPAAWAWGAVTELRLDAHLRASGARRWEQAAAGAVGALGIATVLAAAVGLLVAGAGRWVASGSAPGGALALHPSWRMVWGPGLAVVCWWALGAALGRLTGAAVPAAVVLVSATMASIVLANLPRAADLLPTSWLGRLGGLQRGRGHLGAIWGDGTVLDVATHGVGGGGALLGSIALAAAAATVVVHPGAASRRRWFSLGRGRWWRSRGGGG